MSSVYRSLQIDIISDQYTAVRKMQNIIQRVTDKATRTAREVYHSGRFAVKNGVWLPQRTVSRIQAYDSAYVTTKKVIEEGGGTVASYDNLIRFKKSETLYILGSGKSINAVSASQWRKIQQADSLGFNLFFAHDFVPTLYHMEFTPEIYTLVSKLLPDKDDSFRKIPFLVNYRHVDPERPICDYLFGAHPMFTVPRAVYRSAAELKVILQYYNAPNRVRRNNFLIHYRASLSIAVSLGVLLGYKEIVLLGVDLNNTDYFFHDTTLYPAGIASEIRKVHLQLLEKQRQEGQLSDVHRTFDRNWWPGALTIDQFLKVYVDTILQKKGVSLKIGSKQSALYPMLDLADL